MKNSDWDIDLRDGQAGERLVRDLLTIETIEVKTDRRWKETGNLYIEVYCWQVSTQEWALSGLAISKASHYAFVLENRVLIIPTAELKAIVKQEGHAISCNIPPNPSRGYLIKPSQLLNRYHYATTRFKGH